MPVGGRDPGGLLQPIEIDSSGNVKVAGTIIASNPSVGPNGSPAPVDSTEIGFIAGGGLLQGVSSANPLPVTIISGITNPLPVADAAAEASLAAINTKLGASGFTLPYDEMVLTYVGATTDIDTATSKLSGVTQQTATFTYDGSDRLSDVVWS